MNKSEQLVAAPSAARHLHHDQYTPEQVSLIKSHIATGATDDELKIFLYHCNKTGLDALSKQIYFQKYGGKPVYITAIDGFRVVASRTGEHAGTDDVIFDNESEPVKASVTVYRMVQGTRYAFTATARWNEYCPDAGRDTMWKKMPCTMLGKCAEALALRKAFPNELGGVYVKEEMDQAPTDLGIRPQQPEPGEAGNTEPTHYKITFGKYAQRSLEEVGVDNLRNYILWLETNAQKNNKPIDGRAAEFIKNAEAFIGAIENETFEGVSTRM